MPHLVINVVKRAIMKPSILEKLQQLAERLEEVTHLLGSPEATADMDNYRKLTREHAEITPVVEAFSATGRRKAIWPRRRKCWQIRK